MEEPRARVERGAWFMDDIEPDWYDKIGLGELNMACPTKCILGQLFGSFAYGLSKLPTKYGSNWAYDNGMLDYTIERYDVLTELWKTEIRSRQQEDILSHFDV